MKGAVISSKATPDLNTLSTDTLTWSDIQNKAEYDSSSIGANYSNDPNAKDKDKGVTPNIGVTASGDADSTTKSAISPGTIEVRSNPNQDLSKLSRDTTNSVNTLGKIFDKVTIQEQQELAQMFGELAFDAVGNLGLEEGSPEKAALTGIVAGIMAQLGGGNFADGATSAGVTQLLMNELSKIDDPALLQWASFVIGAAVSELIGGDGLTGGSVTLSDIRNNWLAHGHNRLIAILQSEEMKQKLKDAGYEFTDADIKKMQDGSATADSSDPWNIAVHGMPETTKFEIEDEFSKNMTYAINLERQGKHEDAMYFLGVALHTSQDYYSHFCRENLGNWAAHMLVNPLTGEPLPDNPNFQPIRFEQAGEATKMAAEIFVNGIKTGQIDRNLRTRIFNPWFW